MLQVAGAGGCASCALWTSLGLCQDPEVQLGSLTGVHCNSNRGSNADTPVLSKTVSGVLSTLTCRMENHAFSVKVEQSSSFEGLMNGKEEFTSDSCSHTCSRKATKGQDAGLQQAPTALPSS